jgi:hypothetical protein
VRPPLIWEPAQVEVFLAAFEAALG